jgi:ABC transporter transmembrane region
MYQTTNPINHQNKSMSNDVKKSRKDINTPEIIHNIFTTARRSVQRKFGTTKTNATSVVGGNQKMLWSSCIPRYNSKSRWLAASLRRSLFVSGTSQTVWSAPSRLHGSALGNPYCFRYNAWNHRRCSMNSGRRCSSTVSSKSNTTVEEEKEDVSDASSSTNWRHVQLLREHLWPADHSKEARQLKQRVCLSLGLMMAAKAVTIQVPFVFKHLVDSLPSADTLSLAASIDPTTSAMVPISLLLGYGLSRATATTLQELRNTLFHVVTLDATRNIGVQLLQHTLRLDLQFHLSRSTGQLARIMEHGLKSIVTVLNSAVFHIVPTLLEVLLVAGIMSYQFGAAHAGVVLVTVVSYTAFTFAVTSWRTKFRREMNRLGAEASGRTVDSFLNFETVQYFNNVPHECDRYAETMKKYSASSFEAQQSLSLLNIGQSAIFSVGLTAVMWLTYGQILAGEATIGDLVLANGLLFQVSQRTLNVYLCFCRLCSR